MPTRYKKTTAVNQRYHTGLDRWMRGNGVSLWGAADIHGIPVPAAVSQKGLGTAVSWAIPMPPAVMAGINKGPTQAYALAYRQVNDQLNRLAAQLSHEILSKGFQAVALAASERTDPQNICGDFPHKTAATLAGLGWIGRHCQLVTRPYGSWVRLGTLFTNMPLISGTPKTRAFCGQCTRCVEACPAGALTGRPWYPGIHRDALLDAGKCDSWKKSQYAEFNNGHNCGICSAVCPYGQRYYKRAAVGTRQSDSGNDFHKQRGGAE